VISSLINIKSVIGCQYDNDFTLKPIPATSQRSVMVRDLNASTSLRTVMVRNNQSFRKFSLHHRFALMTEIIWSLYPGYSPLKNLIIRLIRVSNFIVCITDLNQWTYKQILYSGHSLIRIIVSHNTR